MKRFIAAILLILGAYTGARAQQDAQYTQFMFNKLYFNPAIAGSKQSLYASLIYRKQWIGMNGAPQTSTFNLHAPILNQRVGLGLSITNDRIGFSNLWNIETSYSYRIPVGEEGTLSMGLRGSVRYLQMRWNQADPTQLMDGSIPGGTSTKLLPNFGAGIYYETSRFYVGASAPNLFRSKIDFTETSQSTLEPRLERHFFVMGGVYLDLSDKVRFQPNVLLKNTARSPFDMDLNASFIFLNRLLAGVTYRLGDSVDGLIQYKVTPQLNISFAYDFTLTKLQRYNAGSIEVMVDYLFGNPDKLRLHNPRFFNTF